MDYTSNEKMFTKLTITCICYTRHFNTNKFVFVDEPIFVVFSSNQIDSMQNKSSSD